MAKRRRQLVALLSIGLGGCVIVLPACPSDAPRDPLVVPETPPSSEAPAVAAPILEPPPPPPQPPVPPSPISPASLTAYARAVLADGPAAYWRFEESEGSVAADHSGYGRHGAYVDGPRLGESLGDARTGGAVSLESSSDGVVVEYASWTDQPAVTVEAWVRPTRVLSSEGMIIVDKGNTWNLFLDPQGRPAFQLPGDVPPETLAADALRPGRTYHLVGTFENGVVSLYVNGTLVSEGVADVTAMPSRPFPLHVGRGLGSGRWEFQGSIDDVALYDRALTPHAVLRHYDAGR